MSNRASPEEIKDFFEQKYIAWLVTQKGRKTVVQFAEWLGFPQSTVSTWWSKGILPRDDEALAILASKLGMEIFDMAGKPRPDPDQSIELHWQ